MNHASLVLRLTETEQHLRNTEFLIERQHSWIYKLDHGGRTSLAEREALDILQLSRGTIVVERDRLLERLAH